MYQLLALLLIPVLGSGLVFALRNAVGKYLALALSFVQLLISLCVLACFDSTPTVDASLTHQIQYFWTDKIRTSLYFGIDGLSLIMVLLTNILVPIIMLSALKNKKLKSSFYALVLLMQFGLIGVFTSLDGLLFYIFWEVTLIPIWFIVGLWGEREKSRKVVTKFFVYTFVGSLFMLAGLIYIYALPGVKSFDLLSMYNAQMNFNQQTLVFWFIFFAFAVKLPIFPFHTWQADTYTYAPSQGSMLLSGIMLKMAVFGLLRFLLPITPLAVSGTSGGIVLVLAIVGVFYGAFIALVQTDIKRIIAFSSLSHIGLLVGGIFASALLTTTTKTLTTDGANGAVFMAFAHGINVVGLFYCAYILEHRFQVREISQMGGLARTAPRFAVFFLVIIFGSLGVPLTNGFIGEFILIKSIFDYKPLLGILTGLTVIFSAAYLLRLYAKTMFGEGNEEVLSQIKDISGVEFFILLVISVMVIVFGVYPQGILDLVNSSLEYIYLEMIN